ncbi:MAG: endonuclease III [Candidatus Sericytochromatia bacterium]|nr:endonuclease III [Candidatus Sericytochromatia bacterium]
MSRRWLTPAAREAVLAELRRRQGGRGTALNHRNPFELLIAVLLSAQTTDKVVNLVTGPLFEAFPTPTALAALTPETLQPWIARIGLAPTKARHVVETCRLLLARHDGEVPRDREALMALPGVGRKTANVVLSNAFGIPAIPVDTHVFRVANRLGLADADSVDATEADLMKTVPRADWAEAHHWLIWHGREVCKAVRPLCEDCPLQAWCRFHTGTGRWRPARGVGAEAPSDRGVSDAH